MQPIFDDQHNRRAFIRQGSLGIGALAAAWMLRQDGAIAKPPKVPKEEQTYDLLPKRTHFEPTAKAMISLFQHGGPSHMDLTDPKPELSRLDGTEYGGDVAYSFVNAASKKLLGTRWKFRPHGDCGTEYSELLPEISSIADDICLVRSMHTGANGHEVSIRYFHSGIPGVLGRPHYASWLLYGLGSETQNLPSYMVLTDPGGHPVDSTNNWSSGFMPPLYQGTVLRPKEPRILNLEAPVHLQGEIQNQNLNFLAALNRQHAQKFSNEPDIDARIASYELAARMQTAAREALDISKETKATQELYGIHEEPTREYGTRCLIARRLVERGVRFVQLFLAGQPWDNHSSIVTSLPSICRRTDRPSAGLVRDLKQRGMLDETVVHWGGEIGRLPVTQDQGGAAKHGRDHNGQGFSIWFAGGGFKPGMAYGKTDEVGHRAVENTVTPNDYQATLFHLFGLDWKELVFHHNGQQQMVTAGRAAKVVSDIISPRTPVSAGDNSVATG